jgi:hypothetical protein
MMQYVFYVDDNNIIRGGKRVLIDSEPSWEEETALSTLAVRCAHYSQLTATTISENIYHAICIYYQSPANDAGIKMISYSTKNNRWVNGMPDMTAPPPPPPNANDPPLYGTSLSAIPWRAGLEVITGSKMPVVYLQWDNLSLACAQESGTLA